MSYLQNIEIFITKAVIYPQETPKFDILPPVYEFSPKKDKFGVSIEFEFIYGFLTNISITAIRLIELIEYLIFSTYMYYSFGRVYTEKFLNPSKWTFLPNENRY